MATLGAVGDEWPTAIVNVVRKVRITMLGNLRSRLETGWREPGGAARGGRDGDGGLAGRKRRYVELRTDRPCSRAKARCRRREGRPSREPAEGSAWMAIRR